MLNSMWMFEMLRVPPWLHAEEAWLTWVHVKKRPIRRAAVLPLKSAVTYEEEWKAMSLNYASPWAVDEAESCVL